MRPFLKIRLSDNAEAHLAATLIVQWRRARQLATHLPRAIRVYDGLLRGDTSALAEYFPFILDALGGGQRGTSSGRPQRSPAFAQSELTYTEKSEADDAVDLLDSLGL